MEFLVFKSSQQQSLIVCYFNLGVARCEYLSRGARKEKEQKTNRKRRNSLFHGSGYKTKLFGQPLKQEVVNYYMLA